MPCTAIIAGCSQISCVELPSIGMEARAATGLLQLGVRLPGLESEDIHSALRSPTGRDRRLYANEQTTTLGARRVRGSFRLRLFTESRP